MAKEVKKTTTVKKPITKKQTPKKGVTSKTPKKAVVKKVAVPAKPKKQQFKSGPTTKGIVSLEKEMMKNSATQPRNKAKEIELTGPIMTGAFIQDKALFSGDINQIPDKDEEEKKKRSKFNTNYDERQAALRAYRDAKEKAINAAMNMDHPSGKETFSSVDNKQLKGIKGKRAKEEKVLSDLSYEHGGLGHIINNEFEKMGLATNPNLSKLERNTAKAKPIAPSIRKTKKPIIESISNNKLRMEVKSTDQIIDDLQNRDGKGGGKIPVNLIPFSKANSDNFNSSLKSKILGDIDIAELEDDFDNEIYNIPVHKRNENAHNASSLNVPPGIKMMDEEVLTTPGQTVGGLDDFMAKQRTQNTQAQTFADMGQTNHTSGALATLDEMNSQQVGGIGKPSLGGMGNYGPKLQTGGMGPKLNRMSQQQPTSRKQPLMTQSNNMPTARSVGGFEDQGRDQEVDFDYMNKKPKPSGQLQTTQKQLATKNFFSKFKSGSTSNNFKQQSAMEIYRKNNNGRTGYKNRSVELHDDGLSGGGEDHMQIAGDGMASKSTALGAFNVNMQNLKPTLKDKFLNMRAQAAQAKEENASSGSIMTANGRIDKKALEREVSNNFKKLDRMNFEGMSRKTNYGDMYHNTLGQENTKMLRQREKEQQKQNKRAQKNMEDRKNIRARQKKGIFK
jgi:hypothetical protein